MTPKRKTRDEILRTGKSAVWGWYSVDQYKALSFFCQKCTELEEKGPEPPASFGDIIFEPWETGSYSASVLCHGYRLVFDSLPRSITERALRLGRR